MSSDSPERGEEFFKELREVLDQAGEQTDLRRNAQELLRASRGIRLSDAFKPGDKIILRTHYGSLFDEGLYLKLIASHGIREIAPNQPVRAKVLDSSLGTVPQNSYITIDAPVLDGETLEGDAGVVRANTPLQVTLLSLHDFHRTTYIDAASSIDIEMMYQQGVITDFGLGYSVIPEVVGYELLPGIMSVCQFEDRGRSITQLPWVSPDNL